MNRQIRWATALVLLFSGLALAQQPRELGTVAWERNFPAAEKQVRASGKPMLVLFQEVPGWANCVTYGTQVLSHPLVKEAIETCFVPACVYNNTKGDADERVLKSFKESAWNNPVVRMLDDHRKDIVPRISNDWTKKRLITDMAAALKKASRDVPAWIALLAEEERPSRYETAIFGMSWYWVGEAEFGLVDGVLATTAGWIDKYEVVKLRFDPRRISFEDLVKKGASRQCAQQVFTLNDAQQQTASGVIGAEARRHGGKIRPDKQPKYYLFTSPLQFVPMTELQAVRINARMKQKAWRQLLSPGQLEILEAVKKHPKAGWPGAVGVDVAKAWTAAEKVKRKL